MFQSLSFYPQSYPSSLQNHQHNPQYYEQYYTKFYPCQQQQFAHCQQYTDSGNHIAISAADLSFIRDGLQQMILTTERIQSNLDNIGDLLLQSTKMIQSLPSIPASNLAPKSIIVEVEKSKMATTPTEKDEKAAPSTTPSARKDASMKKTPSKVAAAQNIAEKSFVTHRSYILNMQKQVTLCSDSHTFNCWMLFQTQWFGSGKLCCVDKMFDIVSESKNYTLLDVILKTSVNMLVRICVVIFDPGGMRQTTGFLWDGLLRIEAFKTGVMSTISKFISRVENAHLTEAPIQRLIDLIAGSFVYSVMTVSTAKFSFWYYIGSHILPNVLLNDIVSSDGNSLLLSLELSEL